MHDHGVPVALGFELLGQMPCYILIDFCEILDSYQSAIANHVTLTDGYEKTRCAIASMEHSWEQFEPSIVSIHDQTTVIGTIYARADLGQPRILICKS